MKLKNILLNFILLLIFFQSSYAQNKINHDSFIWEPAGLGGGIMEGMTSSPNSPDTLFVSGRNAGIFKSIDGGKTWALHNQGLAPYVTQLLFYNNDLYALAQFQNGLFVSHDEGVTWTKVTSQLFKSIYVYKNLLYGISSDGIFQFDGTKWAIVGQLPDSIVPTIFLIKDNVMYMGGYSSSSEFRGSGIFKSNDYGQSWMPINDPLISGRKINNLFEMNGSIYASDDYSFDYKNKRGIFKSSDNGNSWIQIDKGIGQLKIEQLSKMNHTLYAGTSGGIFKSTDEGNTWQKIFPDLNYRFIFFIYPTLTTLYVGTESLLAKSIDAGETWSNVSGINSQWIANTYITKSGVMIAQEQSGGTSVSFNQGNTWEQAKGIPINQDHTSSFKINKTAEDQNGTIYFIPKGEILYKSIDDGHSWETIKLPFVASSLFLDKNKLYIGTGTDNVDESANVFTSVDEGKSWLPLTNPKPFIFSIISMAVIGKDLYAGTQHSELLKTSIEGGQPWEIVRARDSQDMTFIQLIGKDNNTPDGILYLVSPGDEFFRIGNGIHVSTDGGKTISTLTKALGKLAYSSLAIHDAMLIAGTESGIFVSRDQGKNWAQENSGFLNSNITHISVQNHLMIAGTTGGLYKSRY